MSRIKHAILRTTYTPPDGIEVRIPYSFMGSIYGDDELQAVKRVLDSQWLTTGFETTRFEQAWQQSHGVDYAFTTSNCTASLHMAAQLCGLGVGDEVITTPITFVSTNQAVLALGATPVFVDIDAETWNIDPEQIRLAITPRTKAIFVTHLAGQMCDMDAIMEIAREFQLLVVEDAAHAPGATYDSQFAGSIGDLGCFSFHAIKNMSTLGEGGMITTNRDDFALRIPWLRSMGSRYPDDPHEDGTPGPREYDVDDVDGFVPSNLRMTEAQAAVGSVQLARLTDLISKRRQIAREYTNALSTLSGIRPPKETAKSVHTYHIYGALVDPSVCGFTSSDLADYLLREYGVQCHGGLYRPSYLFSLYRKRGLSDYSCPVAEFAAANAIQLPLYPALEQEDVTYVAESVVAACDALSKKKGG